jgi:hypothetical protein
MSPGLGAGDMAVSRGTCWVMLTSRPGRGCALSLSSGGHIEMALQYGAGVGQASHRARLGPRILCSFLTAALQN